MHKCKEYGAKYLSGRPLLYDSCPQCKIDQLAADKIVLEQEIEKLRDILRIDNGRLEIRMSFDNLHIKQFITKAELYMAVSPSEIVKQRAAIMFAKLETTHKK